MLSLTHLRERVLEQLQSQGTQIVSVTDATITLEVYGEQRICTLLNLHRDIQKSPLDIDVLLFDFVVKITSESTGTRSENRREWVDLYPRVIPYMASKPISHPWTVAFVPEKLDVSLIHHVEGKLHFLSPLQAVQVPGGLKAAKKVALDNLDTFFEMVEIQEIQKGIYQIDHPEILTSSLVLRLERLISIVHPQPISEKESAWVHFALPNRGQLWWSLCSLEGVASLIYREFETGAHPISPNRFSIERMSIQNFLTSWQS